ncbi:hypothetical protein [Streptomyces sp. NBC_00893]|uniref:hypothetical protein n=1 Tax=Streptomyces sp. NBC_00893 TaxID=2975862 RepID=UPI00225A6468|nr:hypothetical protein [Streptomyces sp. NBC_00893]MCX4848413.1 hypothetical protein [Streptomyces sp. NBC_00893]
MNMKKKNLRNISVTTAAGFCLAVGLLGTSAGESVASPQTPRAAPSELKCYTTTGNPDAVVCYRVSKRILNTGDGRLTFVPFLIQVPTPSNPPPPSVVNVLPS